MTHFQRAQPTWLSDRRDTWNQLVGFHTSFNLDSFKTKPTLRITGADTYRIWFNGTFAGCGPARTAEGYARVDEWPLAQALKTGKNHLAIEVLSHGIDSYVFVLQKPFLQAELIIQDEVLRSTPHDFKAQILPEKVQKVERFSKQRPFVEVYRLAPKSNDWRTTGIADPGQMEVFPGLQLLPRAVPLPALKTIDCPRTLAQGQVLISPDRPEAGNATSRSMVGKRVRGYMADQLELDLTVELKRLSFEDTEELSVATPRSIPKSSSALCEFDRVESGFIGLHLKCQQPTRIFLIFDEIRDRSFVLGVGAIVLDLEAGEHHFESMEPYSLKFLRVVTLHQPIELLSLYVRDHAYPTQDHLGQNIEDSELSAIFKAAVQTFRTNAVDLFTDCPSRERGGYPCDSWFTAMAERVLTGKSDIERNFLENYFLPESFEGIPKGMVPHCYPRSHLGNGVYISNWAIWLLLQLCDHCQRSRNLDLPKLARTRVEGIVAWFLPFINDLGLLEDLPGWKFVEWSAANDFVEGVNHPTNMLFAKTMLDLGGLYQRPDWVVIAKRMQTAIISESWDGRWFADQSLRVDGRLQRSDARTETCQYHALWTGLVNRDFGGDLWARLRNEWGPQRNIHGNAGEAKPDGVELYPAGLLYGLLLRLDLLLEFGDGERLMAEIKTIFAHQAELTGTLWEHTSPLASCNHGFASCACHYIGKQLSLETF